MTGRGDLVDAARIRRWAGTALAVQLLAAVICIAGSHGAFFPLRRPGTTDFVSFYAAGHVAASAHPQAVYDRAVHWAAEQAATMPGIDYVFFFYPPTYLLWCRLLALLPYLAAFAVFEAACLALCLAGLRRILAPVPRGWLLPVLSFSPLLWNIGFGQNALLSAALFATGTLLLQRRRDFAGGLVLGLLCYKPHLGLLLPLALLAGRRWRAIAGAAASVIAAVGLSLLLFGVASWRGFFTALAASQAEFATGRVTPFSAAVNLAAALRDHGVAIHPALLAQAVLQAAVAVLTLWCWSRPRNQPGADARYASLVAGAVLVMPVVLFYDLTLLLVAACWIVRDGCAHGFLRHEKTSLAAIWLGGLLCYPVARAWHVPLGLICAAAMYIVALRRQAAARPYRILKSAPAKIGTAAAALCDPGRPHRQNADRGLSDQKAGDHHDRLHAQLAASEDR